MILGQTPRSRAYHSPAAANADHFIYRCYDADGVLIYIGCTTDVKRRIAAHRRGGKARASRCLAACMATYEAEGPYRGRDFARSLEADLIRAERPVFNMDEIGIPGWQWKPVTADYLITHGLRELAIDVACTCWGETKQAGYADLWCHAHRGTEVPLWPGDLPCAAAS